MRAGKTKYTPAAGTRDLQNAIIGMYERDFAAASYQTERSHGHLGRKAGHLQCGCFAHQS